MKRDFAQSALIAICIEHFFLFSFNIQVLAVTHVVKQISVVNDLNVWYAMTMISVQHAMKMEPQQQDTQQIIPCSVF